LRISLRQTDRLSAVFRVEKSSLNQKLLPIFGPGGWISLRDSLATETDETKRETLHRLLAEERPT